MPSAVWENIIKGAMDEVNRRKQQQWETQQRQQEAQREAQRRQQEAQQKFKQDIIGDIIRAKIKAQTPKTRLEQLKERKEELNIGKMLKEMTAPPKPPGQTGYQEAALIRERPKWGGQVGTIPVRPYHRGKSPFTPAKIQQVLGTLQAGGWVEKTTGRPYRFRRREDAENYILSQLGPNWKTEVPRVLQILNRKWPERETEDWWNE